MSRAAPPVRGDYRVFRQITTRWMDNDVYGHVNNVVYYSFFDTAVSGLLFEGGLVRYEDGAVIGLAVESQCQFFAPVSFPDTVIAGIRVDRLGTSSVRYGVGIFRNEDQSAAASGHFTHVYVDRGTRRPVPLTDALREGLEPLVV